MFRNRCWPTTFHTITVTGDAHGWCQKRLVWSTPWCPSHSSDKDTESCSTRNNNYNTILNNEPQRYSRVQTQCSVGDKYWSWIRHCNWLRWLKTVRCIEPLRNILKDLGILEDDINSQSENNIAASVTFGEFASTPLTHQILVWKRTRLVQM